MNAPRTTTLRTLLRLGAALLVLTIVTGWFTWSAFDHAHNGADVARERTVPAILEVTAARKALSLADQAAINSFRTGEARLAGPGEEYQNQIAIASQNLTQAAEDNMAGEGGSRTLRLVQGLLASYTRSIEQAAAIYRENRDSALWLADLWNASQLLHAPPTAGRAAADTGGILAQLEWLRDQQLEAFDASLSPGKRTRTILSWLVPALVLFGLLVLTQVYLTRRFRRVVNPGLLPATVCLLGLMAVGYLGVLTDNGLTSARREVDRVTDEWTGEATRIDEAAQGVLAVLMQDECADHCGYTATEFINKHSAAGGPVGREASIENTDETQRIYQKINNVRQHGAFSLLIPLGVLLIGIPAAAGLYVHVDQYRYRAR